MGFNEQSFGHYDKLRDSLKLMRLRAASASQNFVELANHQEVIIEQAYINYCVSSSTIPLLEEAVKYAELLPDGDLKSTLVNYYSGHIPEEEGHDLISLRDYQRLGGNPDVALHRIPPLNLAAMIGSQYYLIKQHPVAFMGYLACLEVNHPTVEYVETLIERSSLPAEGFSSLMLHATVDIEHKEDIINTLNALPLTDEEYNMIEMSAFQTFRYVALVMEDVCKVANTQHKSAV